MTVNNQRYFFESKVSHFYKNVYIAGNIKVEILKHKQNILNSITKLLTIIIFPLFIFLKIKENKNNKIIFTNSINLINDLIVNLLNFNVDNIDINTSDEEIFEIYKYRDLNISLIKLYINYNKKERIEIFKNSMGSYTYNYTKFQTTKDHNNKRLLGDWISNNVGKSFFDTLDIITEEISNELKGFEEIDLNKMI